MTHDPHDSSDPKTAVAEPTAVVRRRLKNRRPAETFEVELSSHRYVVTIGRFESGEVGEIFINNTTKQGSKVDRAARDSAVLASLGLQYGISVQTLARALSRTESGKPDSVLCAVLDALSKEASR
jgi:hypothetical protein